LFTKYTDFVYACLFFFNLEIYLRVNTCVEVVVGDDFLGFGINHLPGDVYLKHPADKRDNPVKARLCKAMVFSGPFD